MNNYSDEIYNHPKSLVNVLPIQGPCHLLECNISSIDGPATARTALGLQLLSTPFTDGVPINTLPDSDGRLHFLPKALRLVYETIYYLKTNGTFKLCFPESLPVLRVFACPLGEQHFFKQLTQLVQGIHLIIVLLLNENRYIFQ